MQKINVAELLKDCPKGMELDCVSYDNVSFDKISDDKKAAYPIFCYITDKEGNRSGISFTENGCESKRYGAKCVIFPKGKTTWEGFQRPFKDGDILSYQCPGFKNRTIYIYMYHNTMNTTYYVALSGDSDSNFMINYKEGHALNSYNDTARFANEEEKQKLFDAIKANGYKWNIETRTLEKLIVPKFKIGDKVKDKNNFTYTVLSTKCWGYILDDIHRTCVAFDDQDNYVLVPNKFDITTLIPFESRVLVRSSFGDIWRPAIYGFTNLGKHYIIGGNYWTQCIPYEANKELLGTTDDCDDFYNTWE